MGNKEWLKYYTERKQTPRLDKESVCEVNPYQPSTDVTLYYKLILVENNKLILLVG